MGDEEFKSDSNVSKMFMDKNKLFSDDEELSLEIIHRFNIDRDTIESMPAFDNTLKPLFFEKKEK